MKSDKAYMKTLARQAYVGPDRTLLSMPFILITPENAAFTCKQGYGFSNVEGITAKLREEPDCLRQDFLQGQLETEFIIEAPRGQYELLVISGDRDEDSVTILEGAHGYRTEGGVVKSGRYQCELIPMIQKRDEPMRLKISTKPGYSWKLNCIFLNVIKGY